MMAYKDLTGQKFGRLTVLEDVGRTHGEVLWNCMCDCGDFVNVRTSNLQSGNTQSCGCYGRKRTSESRRIDLTGRRVGKLYVLEDVGRRNGGILWKCQCDCGNIVDVVAGNLQSGNTQSCGCYNKDQVSKSISGNLHYNWKGGITPTFRVIRNCTQYKNWRLAVFQKDHFTCQKCNQLRGNINAHHIRLFSTIMEEHNITTLEEAETCEALWDVSNGITLCKKCHRKLHKKKT